MILSVIATAGILFILTFVWVLCYVLLLYAFQYVFVGTQIDPSTGAKILWAGFSISLAILMAVILYVVGSGIMLPIYGFFMRMTA